MSYYAHAIIGIKIDGDKLYQESKMVKTTEHSYPETVKFCPDTGVELWKEVKEPIPSWDQEEETLGPYTMIAGTEGSPLIIGIVTTEAEEYTGGHQRIEMPSIDAEKEKMKEFLEPLGLWDENQFGLHSILRYS